MALLFITKKGIVPVIAQFMLLTRTKITFFRNLSVWVSSSENLFVYL